MIDNISPVNHDWCLGYISSVFPNFKITDIVSNEIFSSSHDNFNKHLIFYHNEPSDDFFISPFQLVCVNFFKNYNTNIDSIVNEIIKKTNLIKSTYFHDEQSVSLDEKTFNELKGNDWRSYSEYINDTNYFNQIPEFVLHEIKSHELNLNCRLKNQNLNQIYSLVKYQLKKLQNVQNYFNSIDKENSIIIVNSKLIYKFLIRKNFKCICVDTMIDVFSDFYAANNLMNFTIDNDLPNTFSYVFFNRKFKVYREKTIIELNNHNLIKFGYVTQNAIPYNVDYIKNKIDGVIYKNKDIANFDSELDIPPWKNHNTFKNIGFSNTLKNLFYLNNNFKALTHLVVETSMYEWCTEKSFQAFFCKRIPLTIGRKNINQYLRNQGFDMFDDIVNYQFDSIDDEDLRIKTAIKDNRDLLTKTEIKNINQRLDKNREFLLTVWPSKYINNLIDEINQLI